MTFHPGAFKSAFRLPPSAFRLLLFESPSFFIVNRYGRAV